MKSPRNREIRVVKRFAFFPVHNEKEGETIWWQHYYTVECYCYRFMGPASMGRQCIDGSNSWKVLWISISIDEIKESFKNNDAYYWDYVKIFKESFNDQRKDMLAYLIKNNYNI